MVKWSEKMTRKAVYSLSLILATSWPGLKLIFHSYGRQFLISLALVEKPAKSIYLFWKCRNKSVSIGLTRIEFCRDLLQISFFVISVLSFIWLRLGRSTCDKEIRFNVYWFAPRQNDHSTFCNQVFVLFCTNYLFRSRISDHRQPELPE